MNPVTLASRPVGSRPRSCRLPFGSVLAVSLLGLAGSLHAHPGSGGASGWMAGLHHPVSGLDHVLAMLAVGLWAAQLGRRALWLLPLAFPAAMLLGAGLGLAGVSLPGVEIGIALSAAVFGLAVFAAVRGPLWAMTSAVAVFAVFHGHAHGSELPAGAGVAGYLAGFVAATAGLHAVGLALGLAGRSAAGQAALRFAGMAVAVCGAAFLWQAVAA